MIPLLLVGAAYLIGKTMNNKTFEEGGKVKEIIFLGKTYRLSPNGGISELTYEQHDLIRTPEFKAWFGDWEEAYKSGNYDNVSKVIAYNDKGWSGEPLVCNHASYSKFTIFNTPSFFSAGMGGGAYGDSEDKDYKEYDVFLNIKNPLNLRGADLRDKFIPLIKDIYRNAGLSQEEIDSRIKFAEKYKDAYGLFKLFEKKEGYGYHWEWVYDYCKKNKYDGFVMNDSDQTMSYTITTWVALYPEQIKLCDGSNITFDGTNPDIRYDNGGEIMNNQNFSIGGEFDDEVIANMLEDDYGIKLNEPKDKYIGKNFKAIFPKVRKIPSEYKMRVNYYYGAVDRLKKDNYTSMGMKKRDLNKVIKNKSAIPIYEFFASFKLNGKGNIISILK